MEKLTNHPHHVERMFTERTKRERGRASEQASELEKHEVLGNHRVGWGGHGYEYWYRNSLTANNDVRIRDTVIGDFDCLGIFLLNFRLIWVRKTPKKLNFKKMI